MRYNTGNAPPQFRAKLVFLIPLGTLLLHDLEYPQFAAETLFDALLKSSVSRLDKSRVSLLIKSPLRLKALLFRRSEVTPVHAQSVSAFVVLSLIAFLHPLLL